ncbi:cytochrome c1 [Rhizosaccharibacter radicis]|uniref:Cytochrome c1 n=1 Tax=Rhizosaccharibacter radicis TaxID=2782605 RepID=A0ABT1VW73_9PROT|nr:cytochrome c1 [Acetobacteraceae bacterium KSS12]
MTLPDRRRKRAWRRGLVLLPIVAAGLAPAAAGAQEAPPANHWSFSGPLGRFDRPSLQRGYAVYAHVCSACHSMRALRYGDLRGLGLTEEQVRLLAEGKPDAPLPAPFPDADAARAANNGALPPDLSRIAATLPGGADAIVAILTGYRSSRPVAPGQYDNPFVPGGRIAMPPPLHAGQVSFTDGTKADPDRMARDVASFLAWSASPHLEQRHRLGVRVLFYGIVLLVLTFMLKRKVWRDVR